MASIPEAIRKLELAMMEEVKKYSVTMSGIRKQIEELRNKCSHGNTTYIADPSGNSDSYYVCDDCGKEIEKQ